MLVSMRFIPVGKGSITVTPIHVNKPKTKLGG